MAVSMSLGSRAAWWSRASAEGLVDKGRSPTARPRPDLAAHRDGTRHHRRDQALPIQHSRMAWAGREPGRRPEERYRKFADSPLEEAGFEPSVPSRKRRSRAVAVRNQGLPTARDQRGRE